MATLTLKVIVGRNDVTILQNAGFSLCLTRDVKYGSQDKDGNVVFSQVKSKDLGPNISLSWAERYQVYGTKSFQAGAKVTVGTNVAEIIGGQLATLEENGEVKISGSSQPGTAFNVQNDWKQPAAVAVNTFDQSSGNFSTIFVSPDLPKPSLSNLLPISKYSVFWDMNLVTDTMFQHTATPKFPFDLTGKTEITLKYEDGVWSIP